MTRAGSGSQRLDPALACLGACVLSLGFYGPSGAGGSQEPPAFHCEIVAEASGSTLVIQGRIFSDRELLSGRYTLAASRTGSGTSNVVQSGDFRVSPANSATVGTVVLSGPGETRATLAVHAGDETVSCALD